MFDFKVTDLQECGITIASMVFEGHYQSVCFDTFSSMNHCVVDCMTADCDGDILARTIVADSTKETMRFV